MRKTDFLYWIQGFLELRGNNKSFTKDQTRSIQKHLAVVKVTESLDGLLAWLDNALTIVEKSGKPHLIDPVTLKKNLQEEFTNVTGQPVVPKNLNSDDKEYCGLTEGNLSGYEPLGDIYNTQRLC